jgi:hypothetical protein
LTARYTTTAGLTDRAYVEQDANFNVTSIIDVSGGVIERYQIVQKAEYPLCEFWHNPKPSIIIRPPRRARFARRWVVVRIVV